MKKNNIPAWFITVSFLLVLEWFSISNLGTVSKPINKFLAFRSTIRTLSTDIPDAMKSNKLFLKDELININGLYGRLTGRRLYNEVVLLNNGMLTSQQEYMKDTGESTDALVEFKNFARKHGARFIYAQFPFKIDMEGETAPKGLEFNGPKDIESTLKTFKDAGINVVDTMPDLTRTPADIEDNFYRTDHHWKPSGAFKAFRIIMDHIAGMYPDENFPEYITDFNSWSIHEIPEQFLGSRGKRVGKFFAGLDSLQWMTPNFETDLSVYIPEEQRFAKGNYEKVFIQTEYLEKGLNVQHTNHYSVYFGKDYPLVQIRNSEAPSSLKLFMIKDSYALPIITFFSTVFREVDVIDPRYYSESSIQEYVDKTGPDLILMATYSSMGINGGQFFKFKNRNGMDRYLRDPETFLFRGNVIIEDSEVKNNCDTVYDNFADERCYTLYIPDIELTDGEAASVSAALFNQKTGKIISETMFDISYCNKFRTCKWVFETPESGSKNLRLLLYAGQRDHTENTGLIYHDVRLSENDCQN